MKSFNDPEHNSVLGSAVTDDLRERAERVMNKPDVQLAMQFRCQEQGHQWETVTVWGPHHRYSYQVCAWCEERQS